jgi:hypothetical protein
MFSLESLRLLQRLEVPFRGGLRKTGFNIFLFYWHILSLDQDPDLDSEQNLIVVRIADHDG